MGEKLNNQIYPKSNEYISTKMNLKEIDLSMILQLSPNEIFGCWQHNKNTISKESDNLKVEIKKLEKRYNKTNKQAVKINLIEQINIKKQYLETINRAFDKWSLDMKNKINIIMKHIFKQYLPNANENHLDILSEKFGNIMGEDRYCNMPIKTIIESFFVRLKEEEEQRVQNNYIREMSNRKLINNEKVSAVEKFFNPALIKNEFNNQKHNKNNPQIYYRSFEFSTNLDVDDSESLELMLINFFNMTSKMLYNTSQSLISELYKQNELYNRNNRR